MLIALRYAYVHLNGFTHYDPHTSNVILCKRKTKTVINLGKNTYFFDYALKPVFIDYGHATTAKHKRSKDLEKFRIFGYPTKGYDAYIFLVFCYQKAHRVLKYEINKLISPVNSVFYNINKYKTICANPIENLSNGLQDINPMVIFDTVLKLKKFFFNVIVKKRDLDIDNSQISEYESKSNLYKKPVCAELNDYFEKDMNIHVKCNSIMDMHQLISCNVYCKSSDSEQDFDEVKRKDSILIDKYIKEQNVCMLFELYYTVILLKQQDTEPYKKRIYRDIITDVLVTGDIIHSQHQMFNHPNIITWL